MLQQCCWLLSLLALGNCRSDAAVLYASVGEQNSACAAQSARELVQVIRQLHAALHIQSDILYRADGGASWHEDWAALLQIEACMPLITLAYPAEGVRELNLDGEALLIVELPAPGTRSADMLRELHRILRRLHSAPMLLLFRCAFDEAQLQYFAQQQLLPLDFLNVNAVFRSNCALAAYGYAPWAGFRLLNRTKQLHHAAQLFPDPARDLRGYTLRSPVQYDAPRAFAYEQRDGRVKLAGIGTYMLQLYMELHKGHFAELPLPNHSRKQNVHMREVFELLAAGAIDISPHLYGFELQQGVDLSYPVLLAQKCLVAPRRCSAPVTISALLANGLRTWLHLAAIALLCTAAAYLGVYCDRSAPVLSLGRAFNAMLLLLLYQPPQPRIRRRLRHVCLLAPMYLLGFIISQLYPAVLLSIEATGPAIPDILTVDDFIAANMQIMLPDYEVDFTLNRTQGAYPAEFLALMRPTNVDVLQRHRTALNSSYAYALSTERWQFIAAQQEHQRQRVFHESQVCLHQYRLHLPIRRHSPFRPSLDAFLLRAAQFGFLIEWQRQAVRDGYAAGILRRRDYCPVLPLASTMCSKFEQFEFLWLVYLAGLACALVVFLAELAWARIAPHRWHA